MIDFFLKKNIFYYKISFYMKKAKVFLFLIFSFFITNKLYSDEYLIENITVYKKEENSSKARKEAINIAQREAFQTLLSRFLINTDHADLISDEEINSSIKSMQIKKEKMTKNSYSGIITINFNRDYILYLLKKYDLDSFSNKINVYLAVPILRENELLYTWEVHNRWINSFKKEIQNSNNVRLIDFNKNSFSLVKNTDFQNSKLSDYDQLMKKYNVNNLLLIYADFNYNTMIIDIKIYIINELKTIKSVLKYKVNNETVADTFNLASKNILEYVKKLDDKEKKKNMPKNKNIFNLSDSEVILSIPISSIYDYQKSTEVLKKIPNIISIDPFFITKSLVKYKAKLPDENKENIIGYLKENNLFVKEKDNEIYLYIE